MQGEPKSAFNPEKVSGTHRAPPGIEIFFVDLASLADILEAEEERQPRLSVADVERVQAMKDEDAGRIWRASRIATRIALERVAGRGLRQVPFEIEPGGRPVMPGGVAHFSISHTGGAALIAVSKEMPIGIDLERTDRILKMSAERRRRVVAAAARFPAQRTLSADTDADVIAAWVRLEAVAKARGTGIGRLLTREGVVGGGEVPEAGTSLYAIAVRDLDIDPHHVGAVAAERLPEKLAATTVSHETFEDFLLR